MSPSRRVLSNALIMGVLASLTCVSMASAQFYEPSLSALDLSTDPLTRTPRLIGMGRLVLTVDDPDYRLDLWDFAGNPLGVADADTNSTMFLRPGTSSASGVTDYLGLERQNLAARGTRFGYEAFHRDDGQAFGVVGNFDGLRFDNVVGDDLERRRTLAQPFAMPILNGPMPWIGGGHMKYAVRLQAGGETLEDQYRAFVANNIGEYIDLAGTFQTDPNFFDPNRFRVNRYGVGGGLSYKFGNVLTAAAQLDAITERIRGSNTANRHAAETRENRPYALGQASLVGKIGKNFEWGADGRGWKSSSEQRWAFSISAGIGAIPLAGRGKLLDRKEEGTTLNTRARWTTGNLTLGGSYHTAYRKLEITPPLSTDLTSLNHFLDLVYLRPGADSLVLADSIVASTYSQYAMGAGGGASWKFSRGTIGAEYHWSRDLRGSQLGGLGPRSIVWDARTGLEYQCNRVLTGRVGYIYRVTDRDDFTVQNEYLSHSVTAGMGVHPTGAIWSFESGYAIEFERSDFGDPGRARATRQVLGTQIRWTF